MMQIAIMGHGVVGSGVAEVLLKNHDSITKKAGDSIEIRYILDLRDFDSLPYSDKFIKEFDPIVEDPAIKVVVEVMGGLHPAYDYVKRCLLASKSVVTSNKELVAAKGAELLQIAKEHNVNFLFEASVGGGIPIIRPISQCLAANEVSEIAGILNGTTNFILTKMIREQMDFSDALKLAQQLGYAERDPSADIDGHDACRKICILASLAFGVHIYPEQVHTEGISQITLEDVEYANNWGGAIKLIGWVKRLENGTVSIKTCPMLIERDNQLSTVDDVFNGILVKGDAIGDVVFYGRGAGKLPTASAVVADVIDCIKHIKARKFIFWEDGHEHYVANYKEDTTVLYIRCRGANVQSIKDVMGNVQFLHRSNQPEDELAFLTPANTEHELDNLLNQIEQIQLLSRIRVADF